MKKLFNNWLLRILALCVAVALWFVIQRYADPTASRTISNIPITVINDQMIASASKTYRVDSPLYASVYVTGIGSVVNSLRAEDFSAVADISQMYDLTGQVPVTVTCLHGDIQPKQVENETKSIKIVMENILTKSFEINLDASGEIAEGFRMGKTVLQPSRVVVRAPESLMQTISRAAVSIDVAGLDEPTSFKEAIRLLREDGTAVELAGLENCTVSADSADISMEILSVKNLPVFYTVRNQEKVASGYRFTGAELSLSSVQVSGLKSRLAELSAITIPADKLDVANAAGDISVRLDLNEYLPDAINFVNDEDRYLTVTLKVEALTTQIMDVVNKLVWVGMDENYDYQLKENSVKLFFRALREDFNHFNDSLVKATVDVSGLTPGSYQLEVKVEVLEDVFEYISTVSVNVEVTERPGTEPQDNGVIL